MEGVDAFAAAAARSDPLGLEDAALLLAAHAATATRPGFPLACMADLEPIVNEARMALDLLAAEIRANCGGVATLEDLLEHLFVTCGFRGNATNYYDPANSLLPQVLTRRVGNPITLATLTMAIGRRIGVELVGVGMPAHFLLRTVEAKPRWVDPFGGGTVMGYEEVRSFFARLTGGRTPFHPSYAEPASVAQVLSRMLANLQAIHFERREPHHVAWVACLNGALPASRPGAVAQAGRQLEEMGQFHVAAQILDGAARRSAGQDRETLEAEAQRLWSRLN